MSRRGRSPARNQAFIPVAAVFLTWISSWTGSRGRFCPALEHSISHHVFKDRQVCPGSSNPHGNQSGLKLISWLWGPVRVEDVQQGALSDVSGSSSTTRVSLPPAAFIARALWGMRPRLMLDCRVMGFTLRQARLCPDLPVLSGREALVSSLKRFPPVPPSFHPVSVEASCCEDPSLPGLAEESVGLPSRFTAVVNLTAW